MPKALAYPRHRTRPRTTFEYLRSMAPSAAKAAGQAALKWGVKRYRDWKNNKKLPIYRGPPTTFVKPAKKPKLQGPVAGTSRHFVNNMIRPGRSKLKKPVRVSRSLMGAEQTILREGAFNFESTIGQQNHYCVPLMDISTDIGNANTIAEVDKELSQAFLIAGMRNNAQGPFDPGTISDNFIKKQRIYLKSFRGTYRMVNTTNAPIRVTIRTIGVKRDTNYQPQDFWDMAARNEDNADTSALTLAGFPPYNNILHYKAPNATPDNLYGWKRLFHTIRKDVIELDAGAEHKHFEHIEYSRPVRGTDLYAIGYEQEGTDAQVTTARADSDPTTQNKLYLKKYTFFVLISVLGPKVQTATSNTQSYNPGQLSVWYSTSCKFYNYPINDSSKYFYNTIPIAAPAGETFLAMDDEDAGDAAFNPTTV